MITIKTCDDQQSWNKNILKCVNFNIFATFEWGEVKKTSWQAERLEFYKKNTYIGSTQILFKNIFGFKLGWCSSGIQFTNTKYLSGMIDALDGFYNLKKTAIRFNFFDKHTGETSYIFDKISKLKSVKSTINSGYTVRFYKLKELDNPKNYSSNNRYYLKKALENNLEFIEHDLSEIEKFVSIHNSMTDLKSMKNIQITMTEIQKVAEIFKEKMKMYSIIKDNQIISSCLIFLISNYAYYFLAAASEDGRNNNASFFMVHELLNIFKNKKIHEFDFGGITPFKESAKGVDRFKRGFGGKTVNYIGERNLCNSKILETLFNTIIKKKLS